MKKWSKKRVIFTVVGLVLICLTAYIVSYLNFTLEADSEVLAYMESDDEVTVEDFEDIIVFTPVHKEVKAGYIYYPGGQVEPQSHAYTAHMIAKEGYKVVIGKMPFNLSLFDINKSDDIISTYPDIHKWYQCGFSLGSAMSCVYATTNYEKLEGLILYAGYTTEKYDLSNIDIDVLSLSGSLDGLATQEKIEAAKSYLPEDTKYLVIEGGNHTQFGIYGGGELQKGDNPSTITREEQQDIIVRETLEFLENHKR